MRTETTTATLMAFPLPATSYGRQLNPHKLGTQALPTGAMDFSSGSTYNDLGQGGAATRPQSMQRKLSAHKLGTQALPTGAMDFSSGSTYNDLGQGGAATRPQSMQRKLSAHKLGTQALPRGGMDFNNGSTASDLGNFYPTTNTTAAHVPAAAAAAEPHLSVTMPFPVSVGEAAPRMRRRGSMPGVDPNATMDFSGGSTLSDLGAHSSTEKESSCKTPNRMRRRGSMPGVDPSSTMDFSAGTTLSDLGSP